jgi:hypothetical protein
MGSAWQARPDLGQLGRPGTRTAVCPGQAPLLLAGEAVLRLAARQRRRFGCGFRPLASGPAFCFIAADRDGSSRAGGPEAAVARIELTSSSEY